MDKKEGKLILIVGPSGSGKGTLLAYVRKAYPDFLIPTSWNTRTPREGEREGTSPSGKKYHFVSKKEFIEARDKGLFLEWDFHFNNYYATPAQEVKDALASGRTVFHEIEMKGANQILEKIPRGQVKIIALNAGSWEDLARRIRARQTITEDEFEKRRIRYQEEMEYAKTADYVIENPDGKLAETQKKLDQVIAEILNSNS